MNGSLSDAVEVATAVRALQLGDSTDDALRRVVAAHTARPVRAVVRQAVLSRMLVEACEARVDALLANPAALAVAALAAQDRRPLKAADIGVQFDRILATQAQALATVNTGDGY